MIDTIYTRSTAAHGNAYFFRLIALSLAFILIVLAAFLNLRIKEVITTAGSVYPAQTQKIYAQDDLWIKLERPLDDQRVHSGEVIATARHALDDAELRYQIAAKNDQIALLAAQKQDLTASREAAARQRSQTIDAEIALLRRNVAHLEQQLAPQPIQAALDGELLAVHAESTNYTFFHKGDLVAEIFPPDKLLVRAKIQPHQAQQLQDGSMVFVEERRAKFSAPGRITRTFYEDGQSADQTGVVVEIQAEQLAQFKLGMSLDVRIVTAERRLLDILGDVFVD